MRRVNSTFRIILYAYPYLQLDGPLIWITFLATALFSDMVMSSGVTIRISDKTRVRNINAATCTPLPI